MLTLTALDEVKYHVGIERASATGSGARRPGCRSSRPVLRPKKRSTINCLRIGPPIGAAHLLTAERASQIKSISHLLDELASAR
jgi:hypothetical protein